MLTRCIVASLYVLAFSFLSGCGGGKAAKTNLVVDPNATSGFTSIKAAIEAAQDGDVIQLKPATYAESLSISKSITLEGVKGEGEVILEAAGKTVVSGAAPEVYLKNIKIRQTKPTKRSAILVRSGKVFLDNCQISCKGHFGIKVNFAGNLDAVNCKISECGASGVTILGAANLRKSEILKCKVDGIFIRSKKEVVIDDVKVHQNEGEGITVDTQSVARILNCEVSENGGEGIYVNGGKVTIENTLSFNNKDCGIHLQEKSTANVKGCNCHGNGHHGISVLSGSDGAVENSKMHKNGYSGLAITNESTATATSCEMMQNENFGAVIWKRANGKIINCDIHHNEKYGVKVNTSADATVLNSKIHNQADKGGVLVNEGGKGRFEGNQIYKNIGPGFLSMGGTHCVILKNKINRNLDRGIVLVDGVKGSIEGNDLRENTRGAWNLDNTTRNSIKQKQNIMDPNPFSKAKVGDFVTYEEVVNFKTFQANARINFLATGVDFQRVFVKKTEIISGNAKTKPVIHHLTKPFDPLIAACFFYSDESWVLKSKTKETLTVDGKELICDLSTYETPERDGEPIILKIWRNETIPLGGLVKSTVIKNQKQKCQQTLIKFGSNAEVKK